MPVVVAVMVVSAVKIKVYDVDDSDNDGSEPPYRDVIYPPGYEVDISQ